MKNSAILTFIFILSTFGFAQSTGKISGKVSYGGGDSPLHEALVRIVQLNRSTETDEGGNYVFDNVPAGKYTIIAHQDGFGDATKTGVFVNGAVSTINFSLNLVGVKEQVTVTASGSEQSAFDSLQSVSTVDSNKILERAGVGLGEVLDKESGVAKRSFGPGNSRPVIRGFDGDRVLVSTDGVRAGSLSSQSGDHGEPIDTLSVERIEVVKGPGTLLYGSNAIGGVVNAISGHDEGFHNGTRGYFSTLGGINNKQAGISGGIEQGYKNFMFWGNGSGQRSSDYKAGNGFGRVANTFTRSKSGTGGGGYFKNKFFATGNFRYYQSKYGIPRDFREANPEIRSLNLRSRDYKFTGGFRDLDSLVSGAKITADYTDYKHLEIAEGVVGTTFRNKVLSYRGVFDQKKYGGLTGRFGFEGYGRKYSTVGAETLVRGLVKQDSISGFALQEYTKNRVTVQFGGRVENNKFRPTDTIYPKRDYTAFSGAIGARIALWEGGAFVVNYSDSTRTPALEELYNNGPHDGTLFFEVGNINLKKERSNGLDFSVRHQQGRVRAEFNTFYYDIKNFVFLAPTGVVDDESGFQIAEYRQGNTRYYGNEFNFDITANKYLSFTSGVDYVNAKLKSGTPLPRIPPLRARFGFDAHYKDLSVRPEVVLVNRQGRTFTGETPTAGYGVFNIAGNFIIPSKHFANIFNVSAYNLTNKLYFNHISAIKDISPEIGRGVRASYTIRFF
jgi:iron complex outermembrane recepter protein